MGWGMHITQGHKNNSILQIENHKETIVTRKSFHLENQISKKGTLGNTLLGNQIAKKGHLAAIGTLKACIL